MSQGRRVIPENVKYSVVSAMEDGATVREVADAHGIDIGTAIAYWKRVYGETPWPAQRTLAAPLRRMGTWTGRFDVIDYECPHCGGIIHHAAMGIEKPAYCCYCGKEVS